METVYLETTVVSYLVSQPSRDLVIAAHQRITGDWWERCRSRFQCVVSQVVLDEISVGDVLEVKKRLEVVRELNVLAVTAEAEILAQAILRAQILPAKAVRDAAHIAVATIHNVQYLLTWNCRHLANAQITRRVARVCDELRYVMPVICTPEELLEEPDHDR